MSRVVIAGTGPLAQKLSKQLADRHEVRLTSGFDLTARHEAEVALAGAEVVVMLAAARGPQAPLKTWAAVDLDRLLADSVARAAKLVGASKLIHFACGDDDVRVPLLEKSGVPLHVLRGGGPDPVDALAALVDGGAVPAPAPWNGNPPLRDEPRWPTCSVQRYQLPTGWDAPRLAKEHFAWLPNNAPMTKVAELNGVYTLTISGVRGLVLRLEPGRSDADTAWYEISEGAFTAKRAGRFEFRRLLDGSGVAALIGYEPSLPFAMYRFTQARLHERVMKRFGEWLETQ